MKKTNVEQKMISVIALVLASWGVTAKADTNMVDCTDVGDQMSWHVSMKSDLSMASHSDNDHETAMVKTDVSFYDTFPPQTEITFDGQDGKNKIKFVYTQELSKGTLYANAGTKDAFEVSFECKLTSDYMDWSAVQQAITDAPANAGSTRY